MKKEINFKREIIYWKILPLFPIIKFLIIISNNESVSTFC